jgi:hypothetical protein
MSCNVQVSMTFGWWFVLVIVTKIRTKINISKIFKLQDSTFMCVSIEHFMLYTIAADPELYSHSSIREPRICMK